MNTIPVEIVAYMAQFLPAIDKLRVARLCHRFHESKVLAPVIATTRMYDPKHPNAFVSACRNAQEHFIDLHVKLNYAPRYMAVFYCARFGHTSLVQKYLPSCHMSHAMAITALSTALYQGRGDIFESLWPCIIQDVFWAKNDASHLFRTLLPHPSNKRAYETLKNGDSSNVIESVMRCDLNPYTAIFFDPPIEPAIMKIAERLNTRTLRREGPVNLEDEIGFAYLVRDEAWITEVQAQMVATGYDLHYPQRIVRAAAVIGSETILDDAIKLCREWDPVDCFCIANSKLIPRLISEIGRAWTSKKFPISHVFKNIDPSELIPVIKELVNVSGAHIAPDVMSVAVSNLNVEVIDFLFEQYGATLPTDVIPGTCSWFCYVHPKMLTYMREVGIGGGTINWVLANNDCLHLLEVKL